MKNHLLKFGLLSLMTLLIFACGKDEEPMDPDPIVSTEDLIIEISENVDLGQVVGTVSGTSNQGSVTFAIDSQTPSGALAIGETTGELSVSDVAVFDFDVNPVITAVVNVTRATITESANVTINLLEANNCPEIDASALNGNLKVRDVGFPSYSATGSYDGCGTFTMTGDILGFLCEETDFILTLVDSTDNLATATLERQPYLCDGSDYEIEGQGVYDSELGLLTLVYQFYENGAEFFPGTFRITNEICNISQDLSAWDGPVSIEVVGGETSSTVGIVDCDQITLQAPNINNLTCSDIASLYMFVTDSGDAEIFEGTWWCDQDFTVYAAQGTYDVAAQEIKMAFTVKDFDEVIVQEGDLIIRPE